MEKKHTCSSEPVEISFLKWIRGFIRKYVSNGTDTFTIEFVEGNFYICSNGTIVTLRSWAEMVKVVGNIYDND